MDTKVGRAGKGASERWLLASAIWLFPIVTVALGAKRWLPTLASEHGAGIDRMINYLLLRSEERRVGKECRL